MPILSEGKGCAGAGAAAGARVSCAVPTAELRLQATSTVPPAWGRRGRPPAPAPQVQ